MAGPQHNIRCLTITLYQSVAMSVRHNGQCEHHNYKRYSPFICLCLVLLITLPARSIGSNHAQSRLTYAVFIWHARSELSVTYHRTV